jgi:hypothetical protein
VSHAVPFLIIAIIILAIAVGFGGYWANQRRQKAFALWASTHGFSYAPRDDTYADLPWGAPFGIGSGRQAQDVVAGTVSERPALCFTLRYQTQSSNGKTTQTQTHYYRIYSLGLPKSLPELRVGPEGLLSGIARMMGIHDIEFESEDFNRAYKVKSDDRKFAYDVVNPQMMQFLLDSRAPGFILIGTNIVRIDHGRLEPATIESTLAYLTAVIEHIPDYVWKS